MSLPEYRIHRQRSLAKTKRCLEKLHRDVWGYGDINKLTMDQQDPKLGQIRGRCVRIHMYFWPEESPNTFCWGFLVGHERGDGQR